MTEPTPSHRLQTINDLLLYRLNRLSALAGAMVVRLCEGGHGITRREWGVVGLLCEQGPMAPSALAERFQLDRTARGGVGVAWTQGAPATRLIPDAAARRCPPPARRPPW